jgi:nicotinamidase/pyrazinamidase
VTKTVNLLVIDPQNDFCDTPGVELPVVSRLERGSVIEVLTERPTLAVAGANADMLRLAGFIQAAGSKIADITVTLDSHPVVAIERPTFWQTGEGGDVSPFTQITAAQVSAGEFAPRNSALRETVIGLLQQLEAAGRYKLMVWPIHCVTGTWGHNIHKAVAKALASWETKSLKPVRKALKGEYPMVEHYGVFEAETPLADVPSTQFNKPLAESLTKGVELLVVAGEASSHCVAASVDQLIRYRGGSATGIVLLTDCMSPVTGFEQGAAAFLDRAAAAGAQLMTSQEALGLLKN